MINCALYFTNYCGQQLYRVSHKHDNWIQPPPRSLDPDLTYEASYMSGKESFSIRLEYALDKQKASAERGLLKIHIGVDEKDKQVYVGYSLPEGYHMTFERTGEIPDIQIYLTFYGHVPKAEAAKKSEILSPSELTTPTVQEEPSKGAELSREIELGSRTELVPRELPHSIRLM